MALVTFTGEEKSGSAFTVAPAGRYQASVYDAEEMTSSKGDQMFKVTWEIISGEHEGLRIFDYLVLNDKALYSVRKCVEALGLEYVKGVPIELGNNLVGRECEIDVKIGQYQQQDKNEIKWAGYHAMESTKIMKGGLPFA